MKKDLGPKFVQYMEPVIAALRALGGSARAAEVVDWVAELLKVNDEKSIGGSNAPLLSMSDKKHSVHHKDLHATFPLYPGRDPLGLPEHPAR